MINTRQQDNLFGTNIYHKIHGTQYGKTHFAHTHGQKSYFICSYIMLLEPKIKYIDGQIKNI